MSELSMEATEKVWVNDIDFIRKNYDLASLTEQARKTDISTLAKQIKINPRVLNRAIVEHRWQSVFSNLEKSKLQLFNSFKTLTGLKSFLKENDPHKLQYRQLRKKIKEFQNKISENPLLILTQEQHDLIIGSGMGDANIRNRNNKNCSFRVAHSKKQKNYLLWKYKQLEEFCSRKPRISKRKFKTHTTETLNIGTQTHPVFNFYYNLFYKNGKKIITKELLDKINERSLAIWICDDGSFCKRLRYIVLCTNSFSLKEHKLIKNFFREKWNLNPTIGFRDNKYYYIRFKVDDTKKLIELIKNYIPVEEMLYKIGK
jgi:hypothetical protein